MGSGSFRSMLVRLHRWFGLNLVIFFSLIFASGTVLVLSDEVLAVAHPAIWVSPGRDAKPATFGQIYAAIHAAHPAVRVGTIEPRPAPWLADKSTATTPWGEKVVFWSDPQTAALRDVTRFNNFREVLRKLHDSLLVPRKVPSRLAFLAVSATGAILLFSVISGLVAYRRFWRGFFRVPGRALGPVGFQGGLHRLLGLWSAIFLLMIATSAVFFFLDGSVLAGVHAKRPPGTPERAQILPDGFDGLALDRAVSAAIGARRTFVPETVSLPQRRSDAIVVAGHTDADGVLSGETRISVDPRSLAVLGIVGPADQPGKERLAPFFTAIHVGLFAGSASRLLWALLGVASIYGLVSGAGLYAARIAQRPGAEPARGALARFLHGLGWMRWLNLAMLVGVVALAGMRVRALAHTGAVLTSENGDPGVALRVSGALRAGRTIDLRATLSPASAAHVEARLGTPDGAPIAQTDLKAGEDGTLAFRAVAQSGDNPVFVRVVDEAGKTTSYLFQLGRAIW